MVASGQQHSARRRGHVRREPERLQLVRSTGDMLGLVWPAIGNVRSWRVVCWDGHDKPIAVLTPTGRHRRATFAGLARLQQPFTVAVSGLDEHGTVVWQDGLADLTLRDRERRETMAAKKTKKAADEKAAATGKPPLSGSGAAETDASQNAATAQDQRHGNATFFIFPAWNSRLPEPDRLPG